MDEKSSKMMKVTLITYKSKFVYFKRQFWGFPRTIFMKGESGDKMLMSENGSAFVAKEFVVDKEWDVKSLILELEGVSRIPEVFVNGNKVKKCGDSYLSFLVDLSHQINFGEENSICLSHGEGTGMDSKCYLV